MKMKQWLAFGLCLVGFNLTTHAQVEQWKVQVKIHPDQNNIEGCFLSTEEVFMAMDNRNTPAWMFNLQSCQSVVDLNTYFDRISSTETRVSVVNTTDIQLMLSEQIPEQEINAELLWAGKLIPIQLRYVHRKNKDNLQDLKVYSFEVDAAVLNLPDEGKIQFTLMFTRKH